MSAPVYINGRFLTQVPSGMQRFALSLLNAWDQLRADHGESSRPKVTVLTPRVLEHPPQFATMDLHAAPGLSGHAWEQTQLLWASMDGVLVSLTSAGPVLHRNHVVVMHDAGIFAVPENFSGRYRALHRFLRPRLAKSARRLATVSEFSREELARFCHVSPDRFAIIPNSAEHILDAPADGSVLTANGLTRGHYFLAVGNQSPNKNLQAAAHGLQLAALPGYDLAVVGLSAARIFRSEALTTGHSVKLLGRVGDPELRSLYENAAALVFPSIYEGFGIPPLEAMTLGCPVISSNTSAMPEVLGADAILVAPTDNRAIAEAMRAVATDMALADRLRKAGRIRSAAYSWKAAARVLQDLVATSVGAL